MSDDVRDTLGLTDGEDLLELEDDIYLAFGIKLDNTTPIATFGDLFDYLQSELANAQRGDSCQTLMAFNRIRAALKPHVPRSAIRPSTPLSSIGLKPREILRLFDKANLQGPTTYATLPGIGGSILMLGGIVWATTAVTTQAFDFIFACGPVAAGYFLCAIDPAAWPAKCRTIGDLACVTAARNAAEFAASGGRLGRDEIWNALVSIVEERGMPGKGCIGRETRFA